MKVYMKPIKMISVTEENGVQTPLKFQMRDENKEIITIKINTICLRDEEKLAGNKMYIFRCQSEIDGTIKTYEIKYELASCKWYLYKI